MIQTAFVGSLETYGVPRIQAELADDHDLRVGRKRVARLMRELGIWSGAASGRWLLIGSSWPTSSTCRPARAISSLARLSTRALVAVWAGRCETTSKQTEGNCFHKHIVKGDGAGEFSNTPAAADEQKIVTKVLMNPPFPTSKGQHDEYEFVDTVLLQIQDLGLLFSVLPYPTLVKFGKYKTWRRDKLLHNNTFLCVMTLPSDLFYPTSTHTVGIFIRKGIPHPTEQSVLWIRAVNDGLLKSKGKRLPSDRAENDYNKVLTTVSQFIRDPFVKVHDQEMFYKACPIDHGDPNFELVPEYYLDQAAPDIREVQDGVEQVIRNAAAFLVREGIE